MNNNTDIRNLKTTKSNLIVPKVYSEVFRDNFTKFILSSGRVSGKTSVLYLLWWMTIQANPDKDIVILQSTTAEIKDSIINEIDKFLIDLGFSVGNNNAADFYIPESKQFIRRRGAKGETRIFPITDYKGGQRTRGITTKNPICLVLYEECQKNVDANVVEQSLATFNRQLDKKAKIVIVGNNEAAGHWFVDFVEAKRKDPTWHVIYANCWDIWNLLNHQTQQEILGMKEHNYIEYRRMYLGDIHASTSDVVIPQFKREKHYKERHELPERLISMVTVGVDHATVNDTFAVVPVATLDDGTSQTLEVCYNDPKETQFALSPSQQFEILDDFLLFLDGKYGFSYNQVPVILCIDGTDAAFGREVMHQKNTSHNKQVWRNVKVHRFTDKNKSVNLALIKNIFAYGVLTILNEGKTMYDGRENKHRLAREIESQRYKPGRKLDDKIPNDLVDALEYALVSYYKNTYNMSLPERLEGPNGKKREILTASNIKLNTKEKRRIFGNV